MSAELQQAERSGHWQPKRVLTVVRRQLPFYLHPQKAIEPVPVTPAPNGPLRDELFKAYVRGNIIVPQTEFGITLYELNAFLQAAMNPNDPATWQEFMASRFSPAQIKTAGALMSFVHHAKSIPVSDRANQKTYGEQTQSDGTVTSVSADKVIHPERLQSLWESVRFDSRTRLSRYINLIEGSGTMRFDDDVELNNAKINGLLVIPGHRFRLEELAALISTGVSILESPQGKRQTYAYRACFNYEGVPPEILNNKRPEGVSEHVLINWKAERYFQKRKNIDVQAVDAFFEREIQHPRTKARAQLVVLQDFVRHELNRHFPGLKSFNDILTSKHPGKDMLV